MSIARKYSEKRGRTGLVLTLTSVFFVMVLYVAQQMFILSLENRIHDLRQEREKIQEAVTILELKAVPLRNSGRIIRLAQEWIGMETPEGAPNILF
jgi:hypothetical protein